AILVLGVGATNGDDELTPIPGDTKADQIVKSLISPGGDIYNLFMEMVNTTYGYILLNKEIWDAFDDDLILVNENIGRIMEVIRKNNVSVILGDLLDGLQFARMAMDKKEWNLVKEATEIAGYLRHGVLTRTLERFSIPASIKNPVEKVVDALLELKREVADYCGCIRQTTYKGLYKEMKDIEKRSIRWSITIQEARKIWRTGKIRKGLRMAGRRAVVAARNARAFNYRLVHSRLPNLVTNTITSVKKVIRPMRELWKKYEIEVITDIDFTRFNIKRPKDGTTRSPYNIDELQKANVPVTKVDQDWEFTFWDRGSLYIAPPTFPPTD
ncbi:unnamed protein product, partial [Owenia fusiformis]